MNPALPGLAPTEARARAHLDRLDLAGLRVELGIDPAGTAPAD
jgi:hypothetical protein